MAPEDLETPVVVEPVYECSSVVHVRNLHPGTRVKAHSDLLGAPIGEKQVLRVLSGTIMDFAGYGTGREIE